MYSKSILIQLIANVNVKGQVYYKPVKFRSFQNINNYHFAWNEDKIKFKYL